jgi:hypothetical protein
VFAQDFDTLDGFEAKGLLLRVEAVGGTTRERSSGVNQTVNPQEVNRDEGSWIGLEAFITPPPKYRQKIPLSKVEERREKHRRKLAAHA